MKKVVNSHLVMKYLAILFLMVVMSNAKISNIYPFVFAFYFACLFVGFDEKLMSAFVVLSYLLVHPSLQGFLIVISCVAVGLVNFYIYKLLKKRESLVAHFCVFVLSQAVYIYYHFFDPKNLAIYFFMGLLSLFVFILVLQVLEIRKNCFKITLDESICFLFSLAVIGLGISGVEIYKFSVFRLVISVVLFLCVALRTPTLTYAVVISTSLGVAISCGNLEVMAEFLILSLLASMFTLPNKVKIVAITLLGDVFVQYFFLSKGMDMWWEILPVAIAGIGFLCMPNKFLNRLSDFVYVKQSEMSSRSLINSTRKSLKRRMNELSNVFFDMKNIHLNMIKKELTQSELSSMLQRELVSTNCKDCLDKNRCTRSLGTDNLSNIETLVDIAIKKGKVSLLDLPSSLSNRCGKVNYIIGTLNRLIDEYRQYKSAMADVNNVKVLLADQMGAVSNLLLKLGDEIDSNISFDLARENKITSRLLSNNIVCKEVLLYSEKNKDLSAVLVVKAENAYNQEIEKVVSEVLKTSMQIVKVNPIDNGDYNSVVLKRVGKYDCMFGLSCCNKAGNNVSGDCHSVVRLGKEKFLFALCDGMGAGERAHKTSAMTLGLIEDFYKVGFENEVVLESVNKLLATSNQENYSTLDVCLLDLEAGIADFIKVGSPFGIIKRENGTEVVEAGALPIGATETLKPATKKTTITTKDIIIMATDGITDAFETEENLVEYVEKLASTNPQTLSDSILHEALMRSGMSSKDDMTVLVARSYLKN